MFKSITTMRNCLFAILISIITLNISCDPPRNCNEPKCLYTNVGIEIKSVLTGNLDSVIKIGDTIKLNMKIPDTLVTNFGNLLFGTLYKKSFFDLQAYSFDSVSEDYTSINFNEFEEVATKFGIGSTTNHWDIQSREYECLFVPKIKGKYVIELSGGRIEMQERNGKEWAINVGIILNNIDRHIELYKSWFPKKYQDQEYQKSLVNRGFYFFEVK